jgi:transcription elongation GreA/GreB family factor
VTVTQNAKEMIHDPEMPEAAHPDKGFISGATPIGLAFVGREEGDSIKVTPPSGGRAFEIVKLVTIHDEE